MRVLILLACALLCGGCFVFDELDHGQELMKQLGPGKNAAKKEAPAAPEEQQTASDGPGVLDRLGAWWDDVTEPEPAAPDPDDEIVACRIHGSTEFMRVSDCQLRGGRAG